MRKIASINKYKGERKIKSKHLEPLHSLEVLTLAKEYHELTGSYYHGFQVFDEPQITVEQYIEDLRKAVEEERAKKNET